MYSERVDEVLTSRVKRRIADAISQRPRTLGELSYATGISVQGVLRHLRQLEKLGFVEERRLSPIIPQARRVYASKGAMLEDYSSGDLSVAKLIEIWPEAKRPPGTAVDLENMSADVILLRRRVREETRRLGRLIDEVAESQDQLRRALVNAPLSEVERVIVEVILTEETVEDGVKALSKFYGIVDRRSIDGALAKAKLNVRK